MSYAGPVSREKRAPTVEPITSPETPSRSALRPLASRPKLDTSDRRENAIVFAAGVAIGVALGASAALLFAPQSGIDTRRAIVRGGRRLGVRGREAWDDLRVELSRAASRARRSLRQRRERSRSNGLD